ncbi:hypothetical protein SCLCIDRAFT_30270 [Scleroderma citrinum Foug A]|uniref:Uncharacterized protein n=1 Tax=Scleroderma citrinum Foug A TaxID=1036808 RepID=A0A0C3DHM5_9AGAM|nr:hypothetical protein SCLCIDRAFT_30270 [Scleroderma citrinum Foug A]
MTTTQQPQPHDRLHHCDLGHHDNPSTLHFLVKAFGTHPKSTEEILPLHHSPKWTPNVTTLIADKKEEAIRDAERADEETQIFTDRSGYQGGIGAAAVLRRRGKLEKVLHFHLGSDKHYTVSTSVYMGVDNQAAILATTSSYSSSSHSLTNMFIDSLKGMLNKHDLPHLAIRWVPGHANIAGNKSVDREAKKAAKGDSSPVEQLPAALRKCGAPAILSIQQSHNNTNAESASDDSTPPCCPTSSPPS